MGVEVPPEAWGGHVITVAEAQNITSYIKSHGGDGMMIWSLQVGCEAGQPLKTAALPQTCTLRQTGHLACASEAPLDLLR